MQFRTLTVRARLALAFGALAFMVGVVSLLSLMGLQQANDQYNRFVHGINARAQIAAAVRTAVDRRAIAVRNLVLLQTADERQAEQAEALKAHQEVQSQLKQLLAAAHAPEVSEEARGLIARMSTVEQSYAPVAVDILRLVAEGHGQEATARMNADCRPRLAALIAATDDYASYTARRAAAQVERAEQDFLHQRALLAGACLGALLLALAAGTAITRSLMRALGAEPAELGAAAQRIAQGDLQEAATQRAASPGSVMESIGIMRASLARIVGQVRHASESIATGSTEIAMGNSDLSQRTEQQASALQETAAAMDQLDSTVKNNAAQARQAHDLAAGASDVALRSGQAVAEVVATMQAIHGSSRRVVDIIGVIDGIAFQTNILALNAAVEAARAGEQGRGFAVVASEVRGLAQRSAEAAREIKTLIHASVEDVERGSGQVADAGNRMEEVVGAIARVNTIVSEITSASQEQGAGISQVSQAIGQIDQVTQQNAALVEESAAAADSLQLQARRLVESVAVFRV